MVYLHYNFFFFLSLFDRCTPNEMSLWNVAYISLRSKSIDLLLISAFIGKRTETEQSGVVLLAVCLLGTLLHSEPDVEATGKGGRIAI